VGVASLSVPVKLPSSHDDPTLMKVLGQVSSLFLDITVEDSSSEVVIVVLVRAD